MIFKETEIEGVFLIGLERHVDERGFFARTFCTEEFGRLGLNTHWPQCNMSHSDLRGTLRGIHYQAWPESEAKLVRVTRGRAFSVVVDLRGDRGTFGRHVSNILTGDEGHLLYVPAGCGLGIQALADGTEVFYQMSVQYRPMLARGIRWDDPDLAIDWPIVPTCISSRDARLPELREIACFEGEADRRPAERV